MFKKSKQHLRETGWSYWYHLSHSIKQSNRLIVTAIKSYIHGIFPCWFKADGPKTVIRMYYEIKRIHHIHKLEKEMQERDEI